MLQLQSCPLNYWQSFLIIVSDLIFRELFKTKFCLSFHFLFILCTMCFAYMCMHLYVAILVCIFMRKLVKKSKAYFNVCCLTNFQTYKCDDKQPPLLMLSDFLTTSVLPFITIRSTPSCHPVSTDFALRLLICCLDSALSVSLLDWLEEIHPATLIICCADRLQECVELVTRKKDINYYVRLKTLVLTAVGLLEKCLSVPDCSLKGEYIFKTLFVYEGTANKICRTQRTLSL